MAITALYSASTGMRALDMKLDVVANNLANINTHGFKRSRVNFEDLMYMTKREPGIPNKDSEPIPHGIQVGTGVRVAGTQLDFKPGGVDPTDNPLDLLIDGEGFFQVEAVNDGAPVTAYTRSGAFARNSEGKVVLANSEGAVLFPNISIPEDAVSISVSPDGRVSVQTQGNSNQEEVGQIELARFVNPEGLEQIGQNLYAETDASGPPTVGQANVDGNGAILQGALEQSNVDPVRELIDLIQTQRGFELNSQSIESADQALRTITNLRRA